MALVASPAVSKCPLSPAGALRCSLIDDQPSHRDQVSWDAREGIAR
jgi:hypothetical protein